MHDKFDCKSSTTNRLSPVCSSVLNGFIVVKLAYSVNLHILEIFRRVVLDSTGISTNDGVVSQQDKTIQFKNQKFMHFQT